jgi:hypothetical protein
LAWLSIVAIDIVDLAERRWAASAMGSYLCTSLTTYLCSHVRRLAALLLALLTAAALPALGWAADNSTRIILLFVINPPDESSRRGVESWIQLFDINIQSLLADFASSGPDVSASIKVLISRKNVDSIDQDGLEASFGQQASLQVLKTVGASSGESTLVVNQIYLGDLKGRMSVPYVFISRKVIPLDYKITREALAVVTLYAYAMAVAAIAPENSRFTVCRVLDRANMYRTSDLDPDVRSSLENLFRAISAELEARTCGGKR